MTASRVPFCSAVEDASRGVPKLAQSSFLPHGSYPVVDQGKGLVAGYSNDETLLCPVAGPVIVFGDHTRNIKYIDFPFIMGAEGVKVLRVRQGWDPRFIFHYLQSCCIPSAGYSRHFKFLKQIRIPNPPLAEQRRISAVLDQANFLRIRRVKARALVESLTQEIFLSMFDSPSTTTHPAIPLSEICSFQSGATPPKSRGDLWNGTLPWFSPKDMKAEELYDSKDHIAAPNLHAGSIKLVPANTVAIVVRGMILAHTVPISILRCSSSINQDLKALLPRVAVAPEFLAANLRAQHAQILASVSTAAHGTKRLDAEALNAIKILRPGASAESEFVRRARAVAAMRERHIEYGRRADELMAGLQYFGFSVRV